jgi:hypothetical protein
MPKIIRGGIESFEIAVLQSSEEKMQLVHNLKMRFEQNIQRHPELSWVDVESMLGSEQLQTLYAMEQSGGEPDTIVLDGVLYFVDCSKETPNRKRMVYDLAAEQVRVKKGVQVAGNALDIADQMGLVLMTEKQYSQLQELGDFDTKTSSWLQTPKSMRDLGGALYGEKRYNRTFIGHNGAISFFSDRGFRGLVKI